MHFWGTIIQTPAKTCNFLVKSKCLCAEWKTLYSQNWVLILLCNFFITYNLIYAQWNLMIHTTLSTRSIFLKSFISSDFSPFEWKAISSQLSLLNLTHQSAPSANPFPWRLLTCWVYLSLGFCTALCTSDGSYLHTSLPCTMDTISFPSRGPSCPMLHPLRPGWMNTRKFIPVQSRLGALKMPPLAHCYWQWPLGIKGRLWNHTAPTGERGMAEN